MTSVKKDDGRTIPFDRSNIERSLLGVGVDEPTARSIAAGVDARDGMTTEEIRRAVSAALGERDPRLAKVYDSTRTMPARRAPSTPRGTVCISEEFMRQLGVSSGQTVEVSGDAVTLPLRVAEFPRAGRNILVGEDDLDALGAREGSLLRVKGAPHG